MEETLHLLNFTRTSASAARLSAAPSDALLTVFALRSSKVFRLGDINVGKGEKRNVNPLNISKREYPG